jgi:signal transduction histidine kinase
MPDPKPVADASRLTRWDRISGPLLSLIAAVVLELLARTPLYVPTPAPILLLLVIYSAFRGGVLPGLASGAIALLHTMVALSLPGTLFVFTGEDLRRVMVFAATLPIMVLLVGRLKESVVRLVAREREARAEVEAAAAHSAFLSEASRVLSSSLDYETTLRRLAHLAVPTLADWCIVDVLEPGGEIRRLEVAHVDPARRELARAVRGYWRNPEARRGAPKVLRTGEPEFVPVVDEAWLEEMTDGDRALRRLAVDLGIRSVVIVPLVVRGRTLGALTLVAAESGRRYERRDVDRAMDLADRAALAVDNARLFGEARKAHDEAERRAREERALRRATEAVTATFTVGEVIQQIAESALAATGADGAFVEQVDLERQELHVVAVAGERGPELGARVPYRGSVAERAIERGEPQLIHDFSRYTGAKFAGLARSCADCALIVVPLLDSGEAVGALVLLRTPDRAPFRDDEIARAHTFGKLASLAFRKVYLLEDSERRREELERITESRAGLMRGFSHDLKNPLGAADGYLQLLEEGVVGELSDEQLRSVERSRRSIHAALELIDELVELARVEAGQLEIELEPAQVREAVQDMAEQYRAQAEAAGLRLRVEVPRELPTIRSDPSRVRQILGNLVSNAVKYTERGEVVVRVRTGKAEGAPRPGEWVRIEIADTGPGIPEEEQEAIFREFTRLAGEERHGAGLGLAISRRIARALGGDITVRSKVGKGSTFTLWLPLTLDEGGAAAAA